MTSLHLCNIMPITLDVPVKKITAIYTYIWNCHELPNMQMFFSFFQTYILTTKNMDKYTSKTFKKHCVVMYPQEFDRRHFVSDLKWYRKHQNKIGITRRCLKIWCFQFFWFPNTKHHQTPQSSREHGLDNRGIYKDGYWQHL